MIENLSEEELRKKITELIKEKEKELEGLKKANWEEEEELRKETILKKEIELEGLKYYLHFLEIPVIDE